MQHGQLRYITTVLTLTMPHPMTMPLAETRLRRKDERVIDLGESPSPSQRLRALVAGLVTRCGSVLPHCHLRTSRYGPLVGICRNCQENQKVEKRPTESACQYIETARPRMSEREFRLKLKLMIVCGAGSHMFTKSEGFVR